MKRTLSIAKKRGKKKKLKECTMGSSEELSLVINFKSFHSFFYSNTQQGATDLCNLI